MQCTRSRLVAPQFNFSRSAAELSVVRPASGGVSGSNADRLLAALLKARKEVRLPDLSGAGLIGGGTGRAPGHRAPL